MTGIAKYKKDETVKIVILGGLFLQVVQQPLAAQVQLAEIRTASNNILVAYFRSPDIDAVDTGIAEWSLSGQDPLEISKWVTAKWDNIEFDYEHHVYLRFRDDFVQTKEYRLTTPHGTATFAFDDTQIYCESIKTSQSAYSALSKTRFANFAIWTATHSFNVSNVELKDWNHENDFTYVFVVFYCQCDHHISLSTTRSGK
jgi:endoglucanase